MALTVTKGHYGKLEGADGSHLYQGLVTIDWDNSYPTGGEAIAATDIDAYFNVIHAMWMIAVTDGADATLGAHFDKENGKLICTNFDDALESDNATDLSGVSMLFMFVAS
jgi:hypothetical protein